MADIFSHTDAINLLRNKYVCFIGDSNIRAQYKDLICLLTANALASPNDLRAKCEDSFKGDILKRKGAINRGRDYKENRQFFDSYNNTAVEFMFITKVYNQDLEDLFHDFKKGNKSVPDIICISSSIWDLNRWGPNGVGNYKQNLVKLMRLMTKSLPPQCLVIWAAATPPSRQISSSFFIKQISFMQPMMRFEILEANWFARTTVVAHGYDVLDCHYYLQMQLHRRAKDGLHYLPVPVRFITNLLLTHIALSWDISLPGNADSLLLQKAKLLECEPFMQTQDKQTKTKLERNKYLSDMLIYMSDKYPALASVDSRDSGLKITINNRDERDYSRKCDLNVDVNSNYSANSQYRLEVDPGKNLPRYWEQPFLNHTPGPTRNTASRPKRSRKNRKTKYSDYWPQPYYRPHRF